MKRILLIANKSWETEAIINALTLPHFSPDYKLLAPDTLRNPWLLPQGTGKPRAEWFNYNNSHIELWCVQDVMEIANPADSQLYSSSEIKKDNLYKIFNYDKNKPDLVLALGTANFGDATQNNNGCVVIGTNVYLHNYHPKGENPKSKWDDPGFEQMLVSSIEPNFLQLDPTTISYIESRLLKPFNNPSDSIQILYDPNYIALSSVNITNYSEFDQADQIGIQAVRDGGLTDTVASVETTHGIIRLSSDARFAFVSGITDRLGHFNDDVNGKDKKGNVKTEAQNYSAAFNIGVYVASMLTKITLAQN